jgi:chemotaxis response regulator CheB
MPRAAVELGAVVQQLPLQNIAGHLVDRLSKRG